MTEQGWTAAADGLTVKRLDPAAFLLLICQVTMTHTELFGVRSLSKGVERRAVSIMMD